MYVSWKHGLLTAEQTVFLWDIEELLIFKKHSAGVFFIPSVTTNQTMQQEITAWPKHGTGTTLRYCDYLRLSR